MGAFIPMGGGRRGPGLSGKDFLECLAVAIIFLAIAISPAGWAMDREFPNLYPCDVASNCDTYVHYVRYELREAKDWCKHLW